MNTREEKMKEITSLIESEEEKLRRKKLAIRIIKIVGFTLLVLLFIVLYTHFYSTKGLIVKEQKIVNKSIPETFRGVKIIHFSDLHYGTTFFDSEFNNVVKAINKRKPDIVVFTGDLIDKNYNLNDKHKEKIIKLLSNITSTLGKYAILGDEDDNVTNDILLRSDFKILNNSNDTIYNATNDSISIVGLSSKDNIAQAFNNVDSNKYSICILHEPDKIDEVLNTHSVDLALAGHSLNGQINIVFPIIRKKGAYKYYKEYYKIDKTKLYISSGLGTSGINFRFGTHPSINFFRLYNN